MIGIKMKPNTPVHYQKEEHNTEGEHITEG
jgi:hypothetical protein